MNRGGILRTPRLYHISNTWLHAYKLENWNKQNKLGENIILFSMVPN